VNTEFWGWVAAGFAAQLVDGALGMAYGVTASTLLLTFGAAPVAVSATVHAAECFTTGASALSHRAFRNIDRSLFKALLLPGILGAVIGASALSQFPGDVLKPWIAAYLLLMGLTIVTRAWRNAAPRPVEAHLPALGFVGACADAVGGGGWGPIVTGTLVGRGRDARTTVGSVNAVEFFVTMAASATFLLTVGFSNWPMIAALAIGGVAAAPLGAWACRVVPARRLMALVGILVVVTSGRTLALHFKLL
jgi:uncharacterized protein